MTVIMRMHLTIVCLLACFDSALSKSKPKENCDEPKAKVEQLTAELNALRQQLADTKPGTCTPSEGFSVLEVISSIAGDVVQNVLKKNEVVSVVEAGTKVADLAGVQGRKVMDSIMTHPCSSDYNVCVKAITTYPLYQTHLAAHVDTLATAAQPHMEAVKPHADKALQTAKKAYGSAVETAGLVRQKLDTAREAFSAEKLNAAVEPAFAALKKASPNSNSILPKEPADRLMFICFTILAFYNLWVIAKITLKLAMVVLRHTFRLFVKVPTRLTLFAFSWSFFFGTGCYMCGLCRRRKNKKVVSETEKTPAATTSETKKADASKPATEKELSQLLQKTKDKGKLTAGVQRLVAAAKSGKPLTDPPELKGKEVDKNVLKKALAKFQDVDIKKLGL